MNQEVHASSLVVESDVLGRREGASDGEELLGDNLRLFTLRWEERVGNANRESVVLFDSVVRNLEQRAEHGSLETATSGDTFK